MWKRTAEEVERTVESYEESGLAPQQYCRREGLPVTALDYYRRRASRKAAAGRRAASKLVEVRVEAAVETRTIFALVLANGGPSDSALVSPDPQECLAITRQALPQSGLGKAAAYTLNMWIKHQLLFEVRSEPPADHALAVLEPGEQALTVSLRLDLSTSYQLHSQPHAPYSPPRATSAKFKR